MAKCEVRALLIWVANQGRYNWMNSKHYAVVLDVYMYFLEQDKSARTFFWAECACYDKEDICFQMWHMAGGCCYVHEP